MRRINWDGVISSAKAVKKQVRDMKVLKPYLDDMPGEGEFRDNLNGKDVLIVECKSSSLRRYVKLMDSFLKLVNNEDDRKLLLDKKIEFERELSGRPDGLLD